MLLGVQASSLACRDAGTCHVDTFTRIFGLRLGVCKRLFGSGFGDAVPRSPWRAPRGIPSTSRRGASSRGSLGLPSLAHVPLGCGWEF